MKNLAIIVISAILLSGTYAYYHSKNKTNLILEQNTTSTPQQLFVPIPFDPFRGYISFNELTSIVSTTTNVKVEFRKNSRYSEGDTNLAADVFVNGEHANGMDGVIGAGGISQVTFSPDDKYLALITRNRSGAFAFNFRVYIVDITNKKIQPAPYYKHTKCCGINEFQVSNSYRWVDSNKMEITHFVAKASDNNSFIQTSEKEVQQFDL